MDKAPATGTFPAFSWSNEGKEAFYIQKSLLELPSIDQKFGKF